MKDFKKLGGPFIANLGEYLREYLSKFPNTSIYVGTDSQTAGPVTRFVTVVALYDEDRRDGVHYIFRNKIENREKDTYSKMWKELELSLEVAQHLEIELDGYAKRLLPEDVLAIKKAELAKPLYDRDPAKVDYDVHMTKLVNIDVDINPELGGGHNKSHVAYVAAKSYLTGLGFRTRFKPSAWAASVAADMRCKSWKPKKKKKNQ